MQGVAYKRVQGSATIKAIGFRAHKSLRSELDFEAMAVEKDVANLTALALQQGTLQATLDNVRANMFRHVKC